MRTKAQREKDRADRKAGMGRHKQFWHGLFKFDLAEMRSAALVAFRVNLFGGSIRLLPAFLTHDELVKGGFDIENATNAKEAWKKTSILWYRWGGDPNHLKKAIINGSRKKAKKLERSQLEKMASSKSHNADGSYSNFDPVSDVAISTYITTGLPLVTKIITGAISNSGAKKNPYAKGKTPSGFVEPTDPTDLPYYDDKTKSVVDPVTGESDVKVTDKEIWGIPQTPFLIGATLISAIAITLGLIAYRKKHNALPA